MIVLDHSSHKISSIADIVLPVAAVSEGDGHYVNYQGRAQRFYQVHAPVLPIQESWRWLDNIADIIGIKAPNTDIVNNQATSQHSIKKTSCESLTQLHKFFVDTYPQWPQELVVGGNEVNDKAIARMSHRASGRTAQMANITVHEAKTTQKRIGFFRKRWQ